METEPQVSTSPPPRQAGELTVGQRVGHIRVERFLARGGMGALYVGFDEKLERRVALKAIHAGARLDRQARARFLREARVLSRLRHPNICQIHDYVEGAQGDFLVLELIEGRSLEEALRQGFALARQQVAERIAQALAAAHAAGVVHRDLKPANVMLTNDGQVKVLDFGLSRFVEGDDRQSSTESAERLPAATPDHAELGRLETALIARVGPAGMASTVAGELAQPADGDPGTHELQTRHGSVLGTLEFMSPEQARGELAGPPSDVYSFGLLLQVLFSGRPVWAGGLPPLLQLQRAARGETLAVTGLDPDLAALIGRMKSLAPSARPSALDVAERLEWLRGKPRRRLRRLARAGVVLALALFGAAMAFQSWRIAQEARRATREADRARQEARAAREVAGFLVSLFEVNDPGQARGSTVTAREILDAGAQRIEGQLQDQPLTRARLAGTMGVVYMQLGLYDQAQPLLQRALALREEHLEGSDAELAQSLHDLATLHHHRQAYAQAAPLYRRALAIRERSLGPDHAEVATSLNALAALHRGQGEYEAAVPLYERALRIAERAGAPDDPELGAILNNLAALRRLQGDYALAEPLYRRSLEMAERTLGPDHPEVATGLNNLGVLYRDSGDLARAVPLFERSLRICEKTQGPDHPDVAIGLANLALVRYSEGAHAEAAALLERASRILRESVGEDAPLLLETRASLARVRIAQGRAREALLQLEQLRGAGERLLAGGPQKPRPRGILAAVLLELGRARALLGDAPAARAHWERALALVEPEASRAAGPVAFRNTRAKALLLLGRDEEARPVAAGLARQRWSDPDLSALCLQRGLSYGPSA